MFTIIAEKIIFPFAVRSTYPFFGYSRKPLAERKINIYFKKVKRK
jgi:hypothetical protein